METSVYIYGLIRFITDYMGRSEEVEKNHQGVNTDTCYAPGGKFKETEASDPHFFSFLSCFWSKILPPL